MAEAERNNGDNWLKQLLACENTKEFTADELKELMKQQGVEPKSVVKVQDEYMITF